MAVTIEKKFYTGSKSYILASTGSVLTSTDLQQIVFTSTNMNDNITAGTRSHTQPGGKYLGTWYESHDILHKASQTQDYPEYPLDNKECLYRTLTLLSGTLDLQSGATGRFWHNYKNTSESIVTSGGWYYTVGFLGKTTRSGLPHGEAFFHYDKDTYGYITNYSFGTTTVFDTEVNFVDITFGTVTGSAVLSGTLDLLYATYSGIGTTYSGIATTYSGVGTPNLDGTYDEYLGENGTTYSGILGIAHSELEASYSGTGVDVDNERRWGGDSIYNKTDNLQTRTIDTENWYLTPMNSVVFQLTFGEAYDCRLTAWDDDTHSTTNNKILEECHYRVDAATYRYGMTSVTWVSPVSTYYHYSMTSSSGCFVSPPARDQILKGDVFYYGDFDLVYAVSSYGECLIFKPRLYNMNDSFSAGNYDFITTLHYQYT